MSAEREFLHEIANVLSISHGKLRMLRKQITQNPDSWDLEKVRSDFEKITQSVDRAVELVKSRHEAVRSQ